MRSGSREADPVIGRFGKKGCLPLTIPKKEPYVKEAYVRQVILALDDADA